jgi:phosphatidylinositol glycan class U
LAFFGLLFDLPSRYFFQEQFSQFIDFFVYVFQFNAFVYTIPLALRLKRHPLFLFWVQATVISIAKAYPAFGDTALHLAIAPLVFSYIKGTRFET